MRYDKVVKSCIARCACLVLAMAIASCATGDVAYYSAPTLLPGVTPAMRTAGFWIGRTELPDEPAMSRDEIVAVNESFNTGKALVNDIPAMPPTLNGRIVRSELENALLSVEKRTLYLSDGSGAGAAFYADISRNMNTVAAQGALPVRFAFAVVYGNVRYLPSNDLLNDIPREKFLDRLQVSAVDIGTPLAVLHESSDKKWYYVRAPLFSGWVEESIIAFASRADVGNYETRDPFVVVTSPKAELWADPERTRYTGFVRMGTRLPLLSCSTAGWSVCIEVPVRGPDGTVSFENAFVSVSQVNEGYLPLSKRSVLTHAFRLLDAPYGWGDMYGEQDCSRFVCEVFGVTGLRLPRNSFAQASAAGSVYEFPGNTSEETRREIVVSRGVPGLTLLRSPGHIMLYIGESDGVPYVIHSFWAYEERYGDSDRLLMVNKTAVSTLGLGEGTQKGSYLGRLTHMTVIRE